MISGTYDRDSSQSSEVRKQRKMNPGIKVAFSFIDFIQLRTSTHHIGGVIHIWGGFSLFISTSLETSLNSHPQLCLRGDSKTNQIDEEDEPP